MTKRSSTGQHDSFELRVLRALAMGASTPKEIAAGLVEPPGRVEATLTWATGAEVVSRLDLPGGSTYSLTPKGLELVRVGQGVALPADKPRPRDPEPLTGPIAGPIAGPPTGPPTGPTSGEYAAPRDVSAPDPMRRLPADSLPSPDPARPKVRRRYLGYAAAYVVVGLFLLVFLKSVVGVVAIVVGIGLGLWTLRSRLAPGPTDSSAA